MDKSVQADLRDVTRLWIASRIANRAMFCIMAAACVVSLSLGFTDMAILWAVISLWFKR